MWFEIGDAGPDVCKLVQHLGDDLPPAVGVGQADILDPVRPRHEGAIDRLWEVGRRDQQDILVLARQKIDAGECRIGGSVNVRGICLKAHALTVRCERFHLIEKDEAWAAGRMFRDSLVEELCDFLLAPTEGGAGQGMRVYLNEAGLASLEDAGHLIRKAPSQRGLPGTWLARENDQSMDRHRFERELPTQLERQKRLRHQALTHGWVDLDGLPRSFQIGLGKAQLFDNDVHMFKLVSCTRRATGADCWSGLQVLAR